MATIDREITELLQRLRQSQQQRVLEFARELADGKLQGIPGANLIAFGGRSSVSGSATRRKADDSACTTRSAPMRAALA